MKLKILSPLLAIAAIAVTAVYVQKPVGFEETLPAAISTNEKSTKDYWTTDQRLVGQKIPATAGITHSEIETEVVHGLQVREDRNCTVKLNYIDIGDGNVVEAYACTPNQALGPLGPQDYDQYDDATLNVMAYSDPVAAEVLGKRLADSDPVIARFLLIRSVALKPENTAPIRWLASAYYGLVAENGEPALREMSENYLLQRIAEELGASGASDVMRHRLIEAGFRDEDFLEMEEALGIDLNEIRAIQVEVTGNSELTEWGL